MIELTQRHDDPSGIVSKLVFEGDGGAVAEAVAYNYGQRGVICFSVQSGCPVGCRFCGTGNRFIRNLDAGEMWTQINAALDVIGDQPPPHIQVMSMSMGDPMLNWSPASSVARMCLESGFAFYVSTVGIRHLGTLNHFMALGERHEGFGLQFSLLSADDNKRCKLFRNRSLPYLRIDELLHWGWLFGKVTGRRAHFNYIVSGPTNTATTEWLAKNLGGMHLTCTPLNSTKKKVHADTKHAEALVHAVRELASDDTVVDASVCDCAGQDTIGGGCGQLHYVQERMRDQ